MAPRSASFVDHARRVASDALGMRGSRNLLSWAVAGTAAYFIWYRPEQQRRAERLLAHEQAKQRAFERGLVDVDRVRPRPDPQDTGVIRGHQGGGGKAVADVKAAAAAAEAGDGGER